MENGRQYGIGAGKGRNGMNDPENGRINFGEEGLNKVQLTGGRV